MPKRARGRVSKRCLRELKEYSLKATKSEGGRVDDLANEKD
jgi:hypothetical protein